MNCSQCGAPIEEGLKFCTQCGARIDIIADTIEKTERDELVEEMQETQKTEGQVYQESQMQDTYTEAVEEEKIKKEKEITRPIAKSKPRIRETQAVISELQYKGTYVENDNRTNRYIGEGRRYQWEGRKGIIGLAETLLAIIINPVTSGEELYLRLSKKVTLIYMAVVILISACMSYLIFITLSSKVAQLFYDVFDYFFGYGTVQYILDEISIRVLLLSLLSNVLLIIYITLLVMVVYRIILKLDIEWIECVQLMMMPVVIGLFGKVIIFVIGLINIKIGLICAGILFLLLVSLTIVQFINRLGLSAMTVYSIPPIYVMSSIARLAIVFQILKGYL